MPATASISSSSLTSSSSSILSEREVKKLEKIMARDASEEQKQLDTALNDVKKAEKALSQSSKAAERAQRLVTKTTEREIAAKKVLDKARTKLERALEEERMAQNALAVKEAHEAETERTVRQAQAGFDDCQQSAEANARDREVRLADVRAQCGVNLPCSPATRP